MYLDKPFSDDLTEGEREVVIEAIRIVLELAGTGHVNASPVEKLNLNSAREKIDGRSSSYQTR